MRDAHNERPNVWQTFAIMAGGKQEPDSDSNLKKMLGSAVS